MSPFIVPGEDRRKVPDTFSVPRLFSCERESAVIKANLENNRTDECVCPIFGNGFLGAIDLGNAHPHSEGHFR
jgi:hypothetical protein